MDSGHEVVGSGAPPFKKRKETSEQVCFHKVLNQFNTSLQMKIGVNSPIIASYLTRICSLSGYSCVPSCHGASTRRGNTRFTTLQAGYKTRCPNAACPPYGHVHFSSKNKCYSSFPGCYSGEHIVDIDIVIVFIISCCKTLFQAASLAGATGCHTTSNQNAASFHTSIQTGPHGHAK